MKNRIIQFTIYLLSAILTHAQEVNRFFSQYSSEFITERTGLPHSHVNHLIQDSQGYIWIATQRGVVRYDGYGFNHYHTHSTPITLKNNFVRHICEDNEHRLWIASEGGIDLIDLQKHSLITLDLRIDERLNQLLTESIQTLYKDSDGNIWLANEYTLWCLQLKENKVTDFYTLPQIGSSPIQAIVETQGEIWAGIDNRICKLNKKEGHSIEYNPIPEQLLPSFSPDWRILCMQPDDNYLWIGTNRGLFRYDHTHKQMKRYRYSTHRPGMLSQAYITDIKLTKYGDLIVATLNGLNVYHRETDTFSFIRQNNDRSNINCNSINCLLTENDNIWLGTESGGVNLLTKKRLQVDLWQPEKNTQPVNAIAEDLQGNLYVAHMERGLSVLKAPHKPITQHLFSPNDLNTISNNTLTGLLIDNDNHLWAYTWGVGINFLDLNIPKNNRFHRYTREEYPSIEGDFINSACEDLLNRGIWFGSTRGLHFYDKSTKSFERILFPQSNNEFEAIEALCTDYKQRLWVGTTQGVYILDLRSFAKSHKDFKYTYLRNKLSQPHSREIEKINCILQDGGRNMWLGGNGSGLYLLTEEKDETFTFRNFTTQDGLASNTISGIAEDEVGNLWITTVEGLTLLNTENLTFSNYTQADGLPNTYFYNNGIFHSRHHKKLYLATANGLAILHTNNKPESCNHPTISCTSITTAGKNILPTSEIQLHEKDSRLVMNLTTQSYGNSHRIRFAYRLKEYEEWNEMQGGENTIRYNVLPAGRYTLQIKATNELGHWSPQIVEYQLTIKPYFYKTVWFYLLMLALVASGVYFYWYWKTMNYRERQEYLEKKVEQRTRELADRNLQLEDMAKHVEQATEEKIAFFTNITHEFRTPVTLIHGPIEHALKQTIDEEMQEQLQIAERNSRYLLSLVNELMDFRKLDNDRVILQPTSVNLCQLIEEWLLPFRAFAHERNIRIRNLSHVKEECFTLDAGYMRKALVNLISNAIKFTPDGGVITIYIAQIKDKHGKDELYINVSDSGYGIVNEDYERIFTRFYQSKQSVKHPVYGQSGTGIGLFLCRKIIELHGGVITARNNHVQGASFRIRIPLTAKLDTNLSHDTSETNEHANCVDEGIEVYKIKKQETVLIVEDNPDMRIYIRRLLQNDYLVAEASNGEEAIEIVNKQKIDLIVSDLMMPVMDGMELSKRIKENITTSHIPFLMLTAIRSEEHEKQSFEFGVDEYLCKPFDEEMLLLRIRNILNMLRRYRHQLANSENVADLPIITESKDKDFMSNALKLMTEHYSDSEYNLDCFVKDMGYSKTLVNKKLQDLTGQPIGQFMKTYRMNMAHKYLQQSDYNVNVSEVAYSVGFEDPKYFTKCFKQQFGYLPSDLLKKKRERTI